MKGLDLPSIEIIEALVVANVAERYASMDLDDAYLHGDEFLEFIHPGDHLLEMGCGLGNFARFFATHGIDYHGIDLSPEAIAGAHSLNPSLRFDVMNARDLAFEDDAFDCILSLNVFNRICEDVIGQVFREMYRVMKASSCAIIILPYTLHETFIITQQGTNFYIIWEIAEFAKHMQKAGFTYDIKVTEEFAYFVARPLK